MMNKKRAPRPERRNTDIEHVDEILFSAIAFICIMGAIMLILGGLSI